MRRLLLNCDLGEGEEVLRTRCLMCSIDLANIACGGHAGDADSVARCVDLAAELGVRIGAHAGHPVNFGRGRSSISPDGFRDLLLRQITDIQRACETRGVELYHVKLHGNLYHLVENQENWALRYLQILHDHSPRLKIVCMAGGAVERMADPAPVIPEAFADRAYRQDGSLVPRGEPGAVLDILASINQARGISEQGKVTTVEGASLSIHARTLCIHSDSPNSTDLARKIQKILSKYSAPDAAT